MQLMYLLLDMLINSQLNNQTLTVLSNHLY